MLAPTWASSVVTRVTGMRGSTARTTSRTRPAMERGSDVVRVTTENARSQRWSMGKYRCPLSCRSSLVAGTSPTTPTMVAVVLPNWICCPSASVPGHI